jgi:predicted nucleic acid-binding protein
VRSNRVDRGCVLDASVALALTLEEPGAAAAARLIASQAVGRARLVAPSLFDVECASGFVKAVRRGRLEAETCATALISTLQLPVERLQSPASVFEALELALRYGFSAYDAVYVALAAEELQHVAIVGEIAPGPLPCPTFAHPHESDLRPSSSEAVGTVDRALASGRTPGRS